MLIVTINKKDYELCNSWADITLRQYIAHLDCKAPDLTDMTQAASDAAIGVYACNLVAMFSNIPLSVLYDCDKQTIERIASSLIGLLNKEPEYEYQKSVTIQGEKFNFPERLMMASKMGEYVEAAQFENTLINAEKTGIHALPKIACALLRKDGEQFAGEVTEERASFFEGMNMDAAWMLYFFLRRQNAILEILFQTFTMSSAQV